MSKVVDVPPTGEVRVDLSARYGGSLLLTARNEDGALIGPLCNIYDAAGERVETTFSSSGANVFVNSTGSLTALSPNRVNPPLEPGAYDVELKLEGYETMRHRVTVKAGETTEVDLEMTASR